MYVASPISRTRSTSPGRAPKPIRFSTCRIVLSSGFAGTADFGVLAASATVAKTAIRTERPSVFMSN